MLSANEISAIYQVFRRFKSFAHKQLVRSVSLPRTSRRRSLPSVPVNEQRRSAQERGRRIRDATRDPSGVPEVIKELSRLKDHRRHRGRQYLDYMVGATREKRPRPVSHRDFPGTRYMRRATSVDHNNHTRQFPIRSRRKNQRKVRRLATSAHKNNNKGRSMI